MRFSIGGATRFGASAASRTMSNITMKLISVQCLFGGTYARTKVARHGTRVEKFPRQCPGHRKGSHQTLRQPRLGHPSTVSHPWPPVDVCSSLRGTHATPVDRLCGYNETPVWPRAPVGFSWVPVASPWDPMRLPCVVLVVSRGPVGSQWGPCGVIERLLCQATALRIKVQV